MLELSTLRGEKVICIKAGSVVRGGLSTDARDMLVEGAEYTFLQFLPAMGDGFGVVIAECSPRPNYDGFHRSRFRRKELPESVTSLLKGRKVPVREDA